MAVDPILRPWKALVALGRQRGYVTRAELREVIPAEAWDERFEDLAVGLYEQGIQIIGCDEAGDSMPATAGPPPGPLPPPKALLSNGSASGHQASEKLREGAMNKPATPMTYGSG